MRIHKEGYRIIFAAFIFLIVLNIVFYFFASKTVLFYFILFLSLLVFCTVLNFFKNPYSIFTGNAESAVVSPADGTVVVVEEVFENEYFHEKRIQVSVFMGITNVHVNWIPLEGKVVHSSHQNGRFRAAYLPKSSMDNERSTIVIERDNGEQVLVRQIAGAMARRIVTYVKVGQRCRINEQLGFIKFGSRVDIFLPVTAEIGVEIDQKVYGNQTVIAQLN
jgi:phosphatidylserine decarboxylase